MSLDINRHTELVLESVGAPVRQLDPKVWPDCILCGRDVNACRCDPHEASAALYQHILGKGR